MFIQRFGIFENNRIKYVIELEEDMGRKKKQYVEEQIFSIYPDFPVLINDTVVWDEEEKPLHFHYYLEIAYCFEGSGVISSSSHRIHTTKGDITMTEANILHTTQADPGVYTRWGNLYIDLEDILKLFPGGETRMQLRMIQESFVDILSIKSEEHPDILLVLESIFRLSKEKKKSYKMQIVGLLYALLFKIYDVLSDEKRELRNTNALPIMPAIEYIYDHYMEPVKVGELAKVCHFSESYFRKVFLEMKGIGPMDYLNSIRIREACRMLKNTTDTIRVIGEKCGYPSVTTFERNFRQRTGMLPSQWRDRQKNPRKKDGDTYEIKRIYYTCQEENMQTD